ncbi:DUF814 domain-containing protein [Synechococcales cyanobacterium C]|uniref:Rqc2 homolog RqcH n=1 Tax=Petrachloros mirabilis ULC683 TaxID=2781853 RepID=A0A8K2A801_9CYAN|nr:DUF814 domain-containing protein [Petrachloros mirabilis ULC683]
MQPVDYTTLTAACSELRSQWLPARLEQVYQCDRFTLQLGLRTLTERGWLTLSWHPQAARICLGTPPPRTPDTFTFSEQLRHQLKGLALVAIAPLQPWERVMDLQFGRRPQDVPQWHLYVEIMGKYSNVILVNANQQIITAAHQVSTQQSRIRPIQTGQPYVPPPALRDPIPTLEESQAHWQERLTVIPIALDKMLRTTYRGVSATLAKTMAVTAGLSPSQPTDSLHPQDWARLFQLWQAWLQALQTETFTPGWCDSGYTVLGWNLTQQTPNVQMLLDTYYTQQRQHQDFQQLAQQLQQKLKAALSKLQVKAQGFIDQLAAATEAHRYRQQADLLMAYLSEWQPGTTTLTLPDFDTGAPQTLTLDPDKTAIQNAQALYKRHQKLKRACDRITPLLQDVQAEIAYLEQVQASLQQIDTYQNPTDLQALIEIRAELIQQQIIPAPHHTPDPRPSANFHRYQTPNGWEILIGRNNHQNDQLTFRIASDYDLWFHTQEIPGSHVLLRLDAGTNPDPEDLQFTANLAAYYSQARQSHQVPVVYTHPRHVYKPKGAKPGMVIYKQEQILWGSPQTAQTQ